MACSFPYRCPFPLLWYHHLMISYTNHVCIRRHVFFMKCRTVLRSLSLTLFISKTSQTCYFTTYRAARWFQWEEVMAKKMFLEDSIFSIIKHLWYYYIDLKFHCKRVTLQVCLALAEKPIWFIIVTKPKGKRALSILAARILYSENNKIRKSLEAWLWWRYFKQLSIVFFLNWK